jgi:hypothetical protein
MPTTVKKHVKGRASPCRLATITAPIFSSPKQSRRRLTSDPLLIIAVNHLAAESSRLIPSAGVTPNNAG